MSKTYYGEEAIKKFSKMSIGSPILIKDNCIEYLGLYLGEYIIQGINIYVFLLEGNRIYTVTKDYVNRNVYNFTYVVLPNALIKENQVRLDMMTEFQKLNFPNRTMLYKYLHNKNIDRM